MIKYPNGSNPKSVETNKVSYNSNRKNMGMTLEKDVELSSQCFMDRNLAIFYKKPTPIHVFKMSKDNTHKIVEAYYEKKSTTDYNGLYRSKYIDFECKESKSHTFSLERIKDHQLKHLVQVKKLGGIAFFLIRFTTTNETFILDVDYVDEIVKANAKHSFNYNFVKEHGYLVQEGYAPRLELLKAIDQVYFKDEVTQEN